MPPPRSRRGRWDTRRTRCVARGRPRRSHPHHHGHRTRADAGESPAHARARSLHRAGSNRTGRSKTRIWATARCGGSSRCRSPATSRATWQVPAIEVTYLGQRGEVLSTHTAPLAVKICQPDRQRAGAGAERERGTGAGDAAGSPARATSRRALAAAVARRPLDRLHRRRALARSRLRPAPAAATGARDRPGKLDRLGAAGFAEDGDQPALLLRSSPRSSASTWARASASIRWR